VQLCLSPRSLVQTGRTSSTWTTWPSYPPCGPRSAWTWWPGRAGRQGAPSRCPAAARGYWPLARMTRQHTCSA